MTSAASCELRTRFGMLGCGVVRKTWSVVAVIPEVLAISRKSGPMTNLLGESCFVVTRWQGVQTSRAKDTRPWDCQHHPVHSRRRPLRRAQRQLRVRQGINAPFDGWVFGEMV